MSDELGSQSLAAACVTTYGTDWTFDVCDGAYHHGEGSAVVYEVRPAKAFGFSRGEAGGQTCWRF